MPDDLLSIGALARAGGLPVTALRFYDTAGVLRPAHVDPATGYRWYTAAQVHTARLIASLRQAGLPVTDLVAVLEEPGLARTVLTRHRRRLEEDLAAAHAHLDAAADILAEPARGVVASADLARAILAVRHAVGAADPTWPGLAGVLLHLDGTDLRLVACDRFRIAVVRVPVREPDGPPVRVVAPVAFLDRIRAASLPETGPVVLHPDALDLVGFRAEPLGGAFPDYEQLVRSAAPGGVNVPSEHLVKSISEADDVLVVRLEAGQVALTSPRDGDGLGFSRTFLLDAVRAARAEHLALVFDDDRSALRISPVDRPDDVGLVMPIHLRHSI